MLKASTFNNNKNSPTFLWFFWFGIAFASSWMIMNNLATSITHLNIVCINGWGTVLWECSLIFEQYFLCFKAKFYKFLCNFLERKMFVDIFRHCGSSFSIRLRKEATTRRCCVSLKSSVTRNYYFYNSV